MDFCNFPLNMLFERDGIAWNVIEQDSSAVGLA
jgi:hypothetical protein